MEDNAIINLYWKRSQDAIHQTDIKYGKYCYSIAFNILECHEDAEESVDDTYMATWNKIPPNRPNSLCAFVGKIARNISISKWRMNKAQKRGGREMTLKLQELEACIPSRQNIEESYEAKEVVSAINTFLEEIPKVERIVFMRRYWCMDSIEEICNSFGFSESKVKSILHRNRVRLKKYLKEVGEL